MEISDKFSPGQAIARCLMLMPSACNNHSHGRIPVFLAARIQAMNQPASRYARVLSIAGSDSGGGAGIQADLKTMSALGCFGMTAITALTAQNTQGVTAIHSVPPEMLAAQIDAVISDIGADAVKIGMLHAPEIVDVVADAITRYALPNVILDPVMVSTSGSKLIADATIAGLVNKLFPLAALVTPNLDEAEVLLGRPITEIDELDKAAQDLLAMGCRAVLLKGGHLTGSDVVDVLATRSASGNIVLQHYRSPRIESRNLHGTGCTLSSAIACRMALGDTLPAAVENARAYILQAITAGATPRTGHGHGPLNHGFAPQAMHLLNTN